MKQETTFMALDFGASSGRAILGTLKDGKLSLEELHRFSNDPVYLAGRMQWDAPRLFFEIKQALNKAALRGVKISSIGIDTWGVDYALLDKHGRLLSDPVHYRDERTAGVMEKAFEKASKQEIYDRTGLAFMPFNTLYQLYSSVLEEDGRLALSDSLLFMPDLFAYCLTGKMGCEYTIASTSQMISPYTRTWDRELLNKLSIPTDMLLPITEPGTVRGNLLPEIAKECGVPEISVIAVAGHDTASAVAAVPAKDENFAYISSGTWSLVGIETPKPVISEDAKEANLTNEGGVDGTIRVLKNVMGLWLIQECKREWVRRGRKIDYPDIVAETDRTEPFVAFIDPDDDAFIAPNNMPDRIADYCRKTGQRIPQTVGEFGRVVYESLAMKYRWTIEKLETATGKKIGTLHIVGGGSNNETLNRMTADALNIPVITGPAEGSVVGNLMMQARALGLVSDLWEMRRVVYDSFDTKTYLPGGSSDWDTAYQTFLSVTGLK